VARICTREPRYGSALNDIKGTPFFECHSYAALMEVKNDKTKRPARGMDVDAVGVVSGGLRSLSLEDVNAPRVSDMKDGAWRSTDDDYPPGTVFAVRENKYVAPSGSGAVWLLTTLHPFGGIEFPLLARSVEVLYQAVTYIGHSTVKLSKHVVSGFPVVYVLVSSLPHGTVAGSELMVTKTDTPRLRRVADEMRPVVGAGSEVHAWLDRVSLERAKGTLFRIYVYDMSAADMRVTLCKCARCVRTLNPNNLDVDQVFGPWATKVEDEDEKHVDARSIWYRP
jgi:hypothetical protein